MGDGAAAEETPVVKKCCVCSSTEDLKRCAKCKLAVYCSKKCQTGHFSYHDAYCSAIVECQELEKDKIYGGWSVRQSQLDFRQKKKTIEASGCQADVEMSSGWKGIQHVVGHRINGFVGGQEVGKHAFSRFGSTSNFGIL